MRNSTTEIDTRVGHRADRGRTTGSAGRSEARGQTRPTRLLGLVDATDGWDDIALCRDYEGSLFFGPNRFEPKHERLAREAEAKAICEQCPALVRCREHALTQGELYGVWGGLGEADRRAILEGRVSSRRAG